MKSSLARLSLLLCISATALSQEHPTVAAQQNSVYVGADGKFESAPDTAQIQFSVSVQDETSQVAFQRASKNVDQVRLVLRANGIDPKSANIGFLSVQPVYEWRPKQHVVGYRVTTDITLKLKDFSKVAPITQQLAEANVSETQTVNYALENIDEAKNHAVEDAYRRARNSAETLARTGNRTLGELSYASIDTYENPHVMMPRMARPMAAMANAAATPAPTEEFTPQTVTVTAHVNALFNLK
jgi:uncharacterized protein YggE